VAENVLGTIFGRADALKRQLYDMIRNPSDYASMVGGRTQENMAAAQALQNQAFSDPQNPLRITNPQALNQLTQMITSGPMGFAPAGITSIVRGENPIQSAAILIGNKIFTGQTHSQALDRAVYEGAVRKEGSKFIYPKDTEINMDLFLTKDGRIIDRLDASKMFDIGASETAIEKGMMQTNPASSITVNDYIKEAEKIKSLLND
jgi:hypothetical protein